MTDDPRRAMHDLGGVGTFLCEPVDVSPHGLTEFDKQVDAIRQLLARRGVMTVDELRRGIEALPEPAYFGLTYYQRWLQSITSILLEKGIVTEAELQAAVR